MHAFGLEETNFYREAEKQARKVTVYAVIFDPMEGKTYAMKFSFSTMQHKFIQLMILWHLSFWEQCNCYPASRGYIFAVWAGVRKVASTDNRSIFYRACAKFVTLFASKILSSGLSSNAASFAERKKLRQLWSATQGSRNGLNRSRTGKKPLF